MVIEIDRDKIKTILIKNFKLPEQTFTIRPDGIVDVSGSVQVPNSYNNISSKEVVDILKLAASKRFPNSSDISSTDYYIDKSNKTGLISLKLQRWYGTNVIDIYKDMIDILQKRNIQANIGNLNSNPRLRVQQPVSAAIKVLPFKFGKVTGNFTVNQMMESLEGCPDIVGKSYEIDGCPISTLIGSPTEVGSFYCYSTKITNLIGSPTLVKDSFYCHNNPLISLEGLPKTIKGGISLTITPNLPLLRLFTVNELKSASLVGNSISTRDIPPIINQYLPLGMKGMLPCAAELLKAGHRDNARL